MRVSRCCAPRTPRTYPCPVCWLRRSRPLDEQPEKPERSNSVTISGSPDPRYALLPKGQFAPSYTVRANPTLGGLHHKYYLEPSCARLSFCGTLRAIMVGLT